MDRNPEAPTKKSKRRVVPRTMKREMAKPRWIKHPPFQDMVASAITSQKARTGTSRQAILKYILENYEVQDSSKTKVQVRLALRRMKQKQQVAHGGPPGKKGAGSFKLLEHPKRIKPIAIKPKQMPKKLSSRKLTPKKPAMSSNAMMHQKSNLRLGNRQINQPRFHDRPGPKVKPRNAHKTHFHKTGITKYTRYRLSS